uniref:Uncharacterized protein n=1 Tax=Poecilia latipinna TaxID=48699 RepID=A0A3B3VPD8_9TELE
MSLRGAGGLRRRAQRVHPVGGRAAPHAQLQVVVRVEGLQDAAGRADGQAERAAALPHHQQRTDVRRPDLGVPAGTVGPHRQDAAAPSLAAPLRAVGEGSGNVVQFRLVQLLVGTLPPLTNISSSYMFKH